MPDYNAPGYRLVVQFVEELRDKYNLGSIDPRYNNLFYVDKKKTILHVRGSDTSKPFHNIDKPSLKFLQDQSCDGWQCAIVLLKNSPHHGNWAWLPHALHQIEKRRWPYEAGSVSYKINHPNGVIGMKAFYTMQGLLDQTGLAS